MLARKGYATYRAAFSASRYYTTDPKAAKLSDGSWVALGDDHLSYPQGRIGWGPHRKAYHLQGNGYEYDVVGAV